MDINVYPFSINISLNEDSHLTSDEFIEYIKQQNNHRMEIFNKDRILTIQDITESNYIAGILLSFRDYAAHCKILPCENGGYYTKIERIEDGAEYNFFIFNKITLKGMWLTYHNSASISVLDKILRNFFYKYAEDCGIEISRRFKCKNKVRTALILSTETIEDALARFNKIHSIVYTERTVENHFLSPDTVNYSKKLLILKKDNNLIQTIQEIKDLRASEEGENVIVKGRNFHGKNESLNLDNIFTPWLSYNYDLITEQLENFNTNNLIQHPIISQLIQSISRHANYRQVIEAR